MNTPAHVIANLLVLGRRQGRAEIAAVAAGGLLPDLPIISFYGWEKLVRGTPEMTIWRESYYREGWQVFFDLFNSLPILAALIGAVWLVERRRAAGGIGPGLWPAARLFFASMALHALSDLPLHNDDAHRHLWPLSDWRFASPVSYWDRDHYGGIFAWVETAAVFAGCLVLVWRGSPMPTRILACAVGSAYLALGVYAAMVWEGH